MTEQDGQSTDQLPSLSVPDAAAHPRRRRYGGRRRAAFVVIALGAVAATAATGMAYMRQSPPAPTTAGDRLPAETRDIVRGDLVSEVHAAGAVQLSGGRDIKNHLTGIVTWTPKANAAVNPGERLYAVDNRPVFLLRGSLPAWREFKKGMADGDDVRMLEQNLAELGYTGFTVDEEFSEKTEAAVKRWQKNNGLETTGTIELGRVVYATGGLRVASAAVRVGDPIAPAQNVLRVTGFDHSVSADVPAKEQDLAVQGAKAEVELLNGKRVKGTISSVGTEKMNADGKKVVPIAIRMESTRLFDNTQSTDIVVVLRRIEAEDVLSVPVIALLPADGGGYAVQLVNDGAVKTVEVKTGAFADGHVEVSGAGIEEGARVGVPTL
ncbi:peptidoglycan-binding protein [Streptomyces sp. NPDC047981]|uniref:peptidoglycan-binding protein n=1 Tax=Streptomyces sp. NPDC047981 TaxID=3154610 RepID=UPI00343AF412